MGDKILVTGASGFTGRALCKRLVSDGATVVAFARNAATVSDLAKAGVEIRIVDIRDARAVRDNFTAFKQVYHIAAAFRTEHEDLDEFRRVNVEGVRNMLLAAKTCGAGRFIHCSTVGVQGDIDDPPAAEDYRFKPGDHYQQTKMEGELLAREYFSAGLPGTVVRPVGIHGPGDTRFLKLFRSIARGRFVMIGPGTTLYHMTYIDDLVQGFLLAGEKKEALGQVFTIGGPEYTTLNELVSAIACAVGVRPPRLRVPFAPVYWLSLLCPVLCRPFGINPPLYPRRVEFFSKSRAFSIEKARRLLGYDPKVNLHEGLKRTADWYREQGLL
ncbi:MAG: SDR family NAD(P)-dependent oxidoreductase [bacterium]